MEVIWRQRKKQQHQGMNSFKIFVVKIIRVMGRNVNDSGISSRGGGQFAKGESKCL